MRAWRNGRRDPKREKGKPKRLTGNQQRRTVADAPNGYFSGSLGKRVSKPMLSPRNDRSSVICRFDSCRPHHGSLAQWPEHPVLTRQVRRFESFTVHHFLGRRTRGASSSGRTSRFERENPGSNPGAPATRLRCHVYSTARLLACLARSHGFESRTWRHLQRTATEAPRRSLMTLTQVSGHHIPARTTPCVSMSACVGPDEKCG
jgi:hypothetical protein